MRKINELIATEFPGVDPIKFEEWKALRLKGANIMMYLIIGISALLFLFMKLDVIQGALGYFLIAIVIVLFPIIARNIGLAKANQLALEIGLKEEDVLTALKQ